MLGLRIEDVLYPFFVMGELNADLLTRTVPILYAKKTLAKFNEAYITGDKSTRQQLKAGLAAGLASKVEIVKEHYCEANGIEPSKIVLGGKIIFKNLLKNSYDVPAEIIEDVSEAAMLLVEHKFNYVLGTNNFTLDVMTEGPLSLIVSKDDLAAIRKNKKMFLLGVFTLEGLFSGMRNSN